MWSWSSVFFATSWDLKIRISQRFCPFVFVIYLSNKQLPEKHKPVGGAGTETVTMCMGKAPAQRSIKKCGLTETSSEVSDQMFILIRPDYADAFPVFIPFDFIPLFTCNLFITSPTEPVCYISVCTCVYVYVFSVETTKKKVSNVNTTFVDVLYLCCWAPSLISTNWTDDWFYVFELWKNTT